MLGKEKERGSLRPLGRRGSEQATGQAAPAHGAAGQRPPSGRCMAPRGWEEALVRGKNALGRWQRNKWFPIQWRVVGKDWGGSPSP